MSNYIPFISSSPPPLESKDSLEDDEFGSFSHAEYINEECGINSVPGAKTSPVNSCGRIVTDGEEQKPSRIKENSVPFEWHTSQYDMGSEHFNSNGSPESSRSVGKNRNSELPVDNFPSAKDTDEDGTKIEVSESLEKRHYSSDDRIEEEASDRITEENNVNCLSVANDAFSSANKTDGCDNVPSDNEEWADFSSAPSDVAVSSDFAFHKDAVDSKIASNSGIEFYTNQKQSTTDDYKNGQIIHHKTSVDLEYFSSVKIDSESDSSFHHKDLGNSSMESEKYSRTDLSTTLKNGDQYTSRELNLEKSINKLQVTDFEFDENMENFSTNAQSDLKSLSSMSDEYVDTGTRLENIERNFVSDDQKDTVGSDEYNVQSSEQCDDVNDDDEFADFVSPSDDGLASIRNHPVKDTDSALGTDTSEISYDDRSEHHNTQDDIETFQPTFEANFDEEFGTYSVASSNFLPQGSTNMYNTNDVINKAFPVNTLPPSEEYTLEELENILKPQNGASGHDYGVWCQLSDFEKTNALTYHWNNSQANKTLLKALNIDSRNLLFGRNWNSSIPIFAANLSFNPLEPIKMTWKPEEKSAAQSSGSDNNKNMDADDSKGIIPPAQFDWNSSGLINPLDGLENELLGPNTDNQISKAVKSSNKIPPLLEQILSNAKLSTSNFPKPKEPAVLSAEAQKVISQLPDLNFMQAKVLMFPIRSLSP